MKASSLVRFLPYLRQVSDHGNCEVVTEIARRSHRCGEASGEFTIRSGEIQGTCGWYTKVAVLSHVACRSPVVARVAKRRSPAARCVTSQLHVRLSAP